MLLSLKISAHRGKKFGRDRFIMTFVLRCDGPRTSFFA